jgi:hypothetical protein
MPWFTVVASSFGGSARSQGCARAPASARVASRQRYLKPGKAARICNLLYRPIAFGNPPASSAAARILPIPRTRVRRPSALRFPHS